MTDAFEKVMYKVWDKYFGMYPTPKQKKAFEELSEAIKSNPALLWPDGEKWMSDEEREWRGVYQKQSADYATRVVELEQETATLRGELEEERSTGKYLSLRGDLKSCYNEISDLRSENATLRSELAAETANVIREQDRNKSLQSELDKVRGELEQYKSGGNVILSHADYTALQSELDKAKERVKKLEVICSLIADKAYYEKSDFGKDVYYMTKDVFINNNQ